MSNLGDQLFPTPAHMETCPFCRAAVSNELASASISPPNRYSALFDQPLLFIAVVFLWQHAGLPFAWIIGGITAGWAGNLWISLRRRRSAIAKWRAAR